MEQVFKALSPKVQTAHSLKMLERKLQQEFGQPGPAPDFIAGNTDGAKLSLSICEEIRDSGFLGFLVSSLQEPLPEMKTIRRIP